MGEAFDAVNELAQNILKEYSEGTEQMTIGKKKLNDQLKQTKKVRKTTVSTIRDKLEDAEV